jgi:riboflavin kinase
MSKSSSHRSVPDDFIGEKEWFFLFWVAYSKFIHKGPIFTPNLVAEMRLSQQTISRRILDLEEKELIVRDSQKRKGELEISAKGYLHLEQVYEHLNNIFQSKTIIEKFRGKLQSGMGEGGHYIRHPIYLEQFYKKIGFFPYFGTLNVELEPALYTHLQKHLSDHQSVHIHGFTDESRSFGEVLCYKVQIWPKNRIHHQVPGALLLIKRTSHKSHIIEFISEQYLRQFFSLQDGDEVCFQFSVN